MHWHIYLVMAVAGAGVVILDLVLGRWASAGALFLLFASFALKAWNGRKEEREVRAAELDADTPDAPRE